MKTNIMKMGVALLAVGLCFGTVPVFSQTTTTVTTTKGAFTEYVPNSETVVVRTDANPAPLRYSVTKQTTVVDESGAPVAIERISPGSQLSVEYTGSGERLVASRIVVQRPTTTTAPVTSAPAVTEQQTTTTATTTRPLTHDEKHAIKEEREHHKKAEKEEIERQKEALEKAKDKLDDDGD
jgi:hypothetical protein